MAPERQTIQQHSAAAIFKQEFDRILQEFVDRVKREIPAAASKGQLALIDSVPTFLDHLILRLADAEGKAEGGQHIRLVSETHAEERAGMGDFTLDQVILEYGVLRSVLIGVLGERGSIDPQAALRIHQMLDQGVAAAARRFSDRSTAQAVEKTEELLKNFQALVDGTPQILWSTFSGGRGEYFNHQWTAYTGLSADESKGEGWKKAVHPEDLQRTEGIWKSAIQNPSPLLFEERLRRQDGQYRWHQVRVNPAVDSSGELRWYGVSTDIHDQKLVESDLRRNLQWLEAVMDSLPVPLALIEPRTAKITFMNEVARSLPLLLPVSLEEYHNRDVKLLGPRGELLSIDEVPRMRVARGEALSGEEITLQSPEHTLHLIVSGRTMPDGPNHPSFAILCFIDITEQKKRAEDLRRAVTELTQERSIRDSFMATLTHDMRSPLQSAAAAAQLIARYPDKTDRHLGWSTKILDSLRRIDRMIEDLLDANRIRAGQGIPVKRVTADLLGLVRETVDDLNLTSDNRIYVDSTETSLPAFIDPAGLRRVFENLINNAVKYGEERSPITVRVRSDADEATVSVHNYGKPIDPETQEVLFEPFRRAREALVVGKKGWGLGLTLVKGIVEAHHGKVSLTSEPGQGTTFSVSIPRKAPEAAQTS